MNELKPCPLCGSKAEVRTVEHADQVYCPNCGARTLWNSQALANWNNRRAKKIKLMPCPLCGGAGKVYESYDSKYYVQCRKCGFTTGETLVPLVAQVMWNRRPEHECNSCAERGK